MMKTTPSKQKHPGSIIAVCACANDFQDRRYGKQRRVMNLTRKAKNPTDIPIYRCSICETLRTVQP